MAKQQEKTTGQNGHDDAEQYEHELADYLQERIKPGLNRGAIPLLARSIAKDIAHREHPDGTAEDAEADQEPTGEADDEPEAASDDEPEAASDDEAEAASDDEPEAASDDESDDAQEAESDGDGSSDFEADMHDLQAELGEDWILRFSVQGDDAWLTAEKDDGSQHVEAPTASVLSEAVAVLNKGGGRSG